MSKVEPCCFNKENLMACKKCAQLADLYNSTPKSARDYWLLTELFVELHGGDVCDIAPEGLRRDHSPIQIDDYLGRTPKTELGDPRHA